MVISTIMGYPMSGLLARIFGFSRGSKSNEFRVERNQALPATEPGEPSIQTVAHPIRLPSKGPQRRGHEVAYYPGRGKAVYADPVDDLIQTQQPLIAKIKQASALTYDDFDNYIVPVIHRYAEYVHLLPASEMDHHADLGGLFRHGLEVAYHACRRCEGKEFGLNEVPSVRKFQFFRWRACALIGGLTHDLGKAVIDVGAVDETGTNIWNPHVQPLYEWTQEFDLTHYFVTWNPNRIHRDHDVISATALDRIIPAKTKRWLGESRGRVPYDAMLMALARTQNVSNNPLMEIIHGADMASVELDLKESHKRMAAIGEGGLRGIGAKFLRTIREKLNDGDWKINQPGQPIWYTDHGLLAMYPTVAKEIIESLRAKGETSVPNDAAAVLQILSDSGLIANNISADGTSYSVIKFSLQASRKTGSEVPVSGTAFMFVNDLAVPEYYVMPPPIPVTIYDPTGVKLGYGGLVEDAQPQGGESSQAGGSAEASASSQSPTHDAPAPHAPQASDDAERTSEIVFGEDEAEADGIVSDDQIDHTAPAEAATPTLRDWANEKDARRAVIDDGAAMNAATFPPTNLAQAQAWIADEIDCGMFGEMLVERINTGRLVADKHYFDVDGCWHFLHNHQEDPKSETLFSCLDDMGADPNAILDQFKGSGWVEPSPGQQHFIISHRHNGQVKRCIRFTYEHTAALMLLTGNQRREEAEPAPQALGPYIDEGTAVRLTSTDDVEPKDGPIIRGAYYAFLHHKVADSETAWHEEKYAFSDIVAFAKQHDLLPAYVKAHIHKSLVIGSGEALSYNPGYDPIVDEVESDKENQE